MKIMFVVKSKTIETLGPQYLAAVVKQAGQDARIVDIQEAYRSFKTYKPDIVAYSIMTGDQERFRELNRKLKQIRSFTAMVGGADVTFFPQGYENDPHINVVVKGEGEQVLADLLVSGHKYPDLDSIPWPDRTDFPKMAIRDFLASRGCLFSCSYCYNSAWKKQFPDLAAVRTRSAKDVVNEVAHVAPKFAYFQDSCFGSGMKWMREFAHHYSGVRIPYHAHLRPSQVNEERVVLLSDTNCVSVKCALETGSDRLRKLINRGHTNNEDAIKASRLLEKWGIKLILQNILGLASSTIEEDLETLEVNIRCKPAYAWSSIFQPYPMTELAILCEKEGWYSGDYTEIGDNFFDKSVLNFDEQHKEQVACLQRVFAFCVEMQTMPKIEDLSWERLPKFVHDTMRKIGDKRMFVGVTI